MDQDLTADVLICGAGAAGLTLALDLARRGVSFRLIEQMDEPFRGSRGKGIQPRTLEVFEDLGIVDRIVAAGGPYPVLREYLAGGRSVQSPGGEAMERTPGLPYVMPLMLPQFLTEHVMRERLAELGHRVEFGVRLTGFTQNEHCVTARLESRSGEESIGVQYLIGCDGGRSFIRNALEIDFPGKTLGVRAVVADVILEGLERDAWHRFMPAGVDQQIMACPLEGTDLFQLQAPIPLEGEVDLSAAGLTDMIAQRSGRTDIRVLSVSWASAYNMSARLADKYRVGRVFLVGDAAHVHPPTGGQGLNTSVQDAYNLGWKLASVLAGADDSLLDTYEEERRPIAAGMLGLATRLLDEHKQGEMRRTRETRQLDLAYSDSSLVLPDPQRILHPIAGDRAPDAPIQGAAGQPTRVFKLFQGPHWTLIGYDVARDSVPPRAGLHIHTFGPRGDLIDDSGHFRNEYSVVAGDWVLVRPDGYISAIVASSNLPALEKHLESFVFLPD